MSPGRTEGDDLSLCMNAGVSPARPNDPDPLLGNRCQRPLYLPLDCQTISLYLEAKVVSAIVFDDGHEFLDVGLRFLY